MDDCPDRYRSAQQRWVSPGVGVRLNWKDVHVWRCKLDASESGSSSLVRLLSADELIRAGRFVFKTDRDRFVIARAFLRSVLGRYLVCAPERIKLAYGTNGKPALRISHLRQPIGFNLAHTADWAVCAVATTDLLGIDIESERFQVDVSALAKSCFSEHEQASLESLDQVQKQAAFFNGWVRKEAFIKAVGEGLQIPLDSFDVSILPGEKPQLIAIGGSREEAQAWLTEAFSPAAGCVGAVAVRGTDWRFRFFDFSFEPRASLAEIVAPT